MYLLATLVALFTAFFVLGVVVGWLLHDRKEPFFQEQFTTISQPQLDETLAIPAPASKIRLTPDQVKNAPQVDCEENTCGEPWYCEVKGRRLCVVHAVEAEDSLGETEKVYGRRYPSQ